MKQTKISPSCSSLYSWWPTSILNNSERDSLKKKKCTNETRLGVTFYLWIYFQNNMFTQCHGTPDWNKLHPLSEKLASFGIMEAQLRAPLQSAQNDSVVMVRGVSKGHSIWPLWCKERWTAIRLIAVVFLVRMA